MKCNFCGSENNEIIWEYMILERNNILNRSKFAKPENSELKGNCLRWIAKR